MYECCHWDTAWMLLTGSHSRCCYALDTGKMVWEDLSRPYLPVKELLPLVGFWGQESHLSTGGLSTL